MHGCQPPSTLTPWVIHRRAGFLAVPMLRELGLVLTIVVVFMGGLFAFQTADIEQDTLGGDGTAQSLSERPVRKLSLSEDGHRLWFLHGPDEVAEVNLAAATTETLYRSPTEHILHAAHSIQGSTAIAVLDDYEVHFLRNGELVWVDEVDLVRQSPLHLAVSADGNTVLLVFNRGAVRGWDLSTETPTSFQYDLPDLTVSACMDSAGRRLFAAHHDGTLVAYDARTGRGMRKFADQQCRCSAMALSSDGLWWATAGTDQRLRLWDVSSGREVWSTSTAELGEVWTLALSADNGWVAAGGANEGGVLVWSIPERKLARRLIGHECPVRALCFSPKESTLYSAGLDGTIRAWSVTLGRELRRLL